MEAFGAKVRSAFETFDPDDARLVKELRVLLASRRDLLAEESGADGLELCRGLSDTADLLLATFLEASPHGGGLAILALGGYGRGELNPFSDIDLMVLYPPGAAERASQVAGPLIAFLWDLGYVVGHATRTPEESREAMEGDVPSATALLEGRLVTGSRVLFRDFVSTVIDPWLKARGVEFIGKKIEEVRARHRFYGGSPRLAVPNVKEGAGGLRDLHVAGWIALALSGRKDFSVFREAGILTEAGSRDLLSAYSDILLIRNALHLTAGSKQDVLEFGIRGQVAERLGFVDGEGLYAAERFMRTYYRAAGRLNRFLCRVIRFQEGCAIGERRAFSDGLIEVGAEVYPTGELIGPQEALRAVIRTVDGGYTPSPELMDAVGATVLGIDDAFRTDPTVSRQFLDLLGMPSAATGLRALHEAGFLAEYLPELGRVRGLAREDPLHQYTVDEHILRAVEALDGFGAEQGPLSEDLSRVERPDLLRLALLLHDIGKAWGKDHVYRGLEMLPEVTRRLGLSEEEASLVRFLVKRHVLMTALVDRRAPGEAAEVLAKKVPDRAHLRTLYLHTLADVSAVGLGALSGWREGQIRELYEQALAILSPEPARPLLERVVLAGGGSRREEARDHLQAMGPRYTLEMQPSRVLLHLELIRKLAEKPVALTCLPGRAWGEVWVASRDAPGLFARIAGVLALHGLSILAARADTRADGVVLDRFFVTRPGDALAEDDPLWRAVAEDLCRADDGSLDLEQRLLAVRRRYRSEESALAGPPPGVTASNLISPEFTVVEVTARDRPALLTDLALAAARSGFSIHHAVIATRGAVVMDTFYISRPDGRRPDADELLGLLADLESQVAAIPE